MGVLNLKIIVIGAGIGGLATAIACKEKGFDVTVLESQSEFLHVSIIALYVDTQEAPKR